MAYKNGSPITPLEAQQKSFVPPALYQNQGEEFRPPYGETDRLPSIPSPPPSFVQGPPRHPRSPATVSPSTTSPGLPLEALLGAVVGTLTILLILLAVLLVFLIRRQQHNNSSPPASPALEEEEICQPASASSRPLPRPPPIPLQQAPRRRPPPPPPPPLPERPLYCNNAFRPTPAQRNQGPGSAEKKMKDEAGTDPCYYQLVTPIGSTDTPSMDNPESSLSSGRRKPEGSVARADRTARGSVTSMARTGGSLSSSGRAGGSVASTGQTTIDWSCKSCDLTLETYSCFSMCNSDTADQRDTDIRDLAEKEMVQEKEMEEKKEMLAKKEFLEKREMFDKKEPTNNCNVLHKSIKTSSSITAPREVMVGSKEDVERPAKPPQQVPEEQSPSWDSKTYGEPMWKRGDLALELD